MIDSGAQVNLIDQVTFDALSRKTRHALAKRKLFANQAEFPIRVIDEFKVKLKTKDFVTNAEFNVVDS